MQYCYKCRNKKNLSRKQLNTILEDDVKFVNRKSAITQLILEKFILL